MKKIDVINAANILGSLAINKIKKAEVKTPLLLDYIKIRKAAEAYQDEQKTLVDKFQKDYKDEIAEVGGLRDRGEEIVGHDAFLNAEQEANKLLKENINSECSVDGLTLIPFDSFAEAVADTDLSLEAISLLSNVILE